MSQHDDDAELVREPARRYLDAAASPEHLKELLEQPGGFDSTIWAGAVELGWPAAALPERHGGLELGWRALCVLAEELGRKAVSLPLIGSAAVAQLLLDSGNEQALRHLPALASGEQHACLALCQPDCSGLAVQPRMSWWNGKLSGRTAVTPFGASAAFALVPARADGALVLLLVSLDQPGAMRQVAPSIDNSRAAAALHFDGASAIVLGDAAAAEARLWQTASLAALATAFEQVGGAQSSLELARDYALERKAFGQPIGRFQAIKSKLADIYIRIELARGCALDALAALESGDERWPSLAAAARVAAIDAYDVAARETIQTHGAIGVTWEAMPHHHYRRARALALELGAGLAWRERLLATAVFENLANHE
ncbi:MAG: acyl-CoA dehydrogenase family protein [Pseudomonadota bacterium]